MSDEKKQNFILKILDKVFAFLTKSRCACCNSTCIVGDDVLNNTESKPASPSIEPDERTPMGELM